MPSGSLLPGPKIPPFYFSLFRQWPTIFPLPCSHHHAICTSLISWLDLNAVWSLLHPPWEQWPVAGPAHQFAVLDLGATSDWLSVTWMVLLRNSALKNHIEGQILWWHKIMILQLPESLCYEWSWGGLGAVLSMPNITFHLGWRGCSLAGLRDWCSCSPIFCSLKR